MTSYEYPTPRYRDRAEAGRVLAARLTPYRRENPVLLAIPNGGVPVAAVIAEELKVKLFLMVARKLQIPENPEAGFGAVTADGNIILNHALVAALGLREQQIHRQKEKALAEARLKQSAFPERTKLPTVTGTLVILVDDGLASGYTMEAAIESVKAQGVREIVVAVPTSSLAAHRRLETRVARIICPELGRLRVFAVANAYKNWYDVSEDEVREILRDLHEMNL